MTTLEKVILGMLALIAVYLVLSQYTGANQILKGLGGFFVGQTTTLQGRTTNGN